MGQTAKTATTTNNPAGAKVFRKWSAKEEKKRQTQEELAELAQKVSEFVSVTHLLGYEHGRQVGDLLGGLDGMRRVKEAERYRWTQRPFLERLRYLFNPKSVI